MEKLFGHIIIKPFAHLDVVA